MLIGAIGAPRGVVCFPFHPNNAAEARFIASTQKFFQNPKRSGEALQRLPARLSFAQADGKRLRPLLLFRQKRHGKIRPVFGLHHQRGPPSWARPPHLSPRQTVPRQIDRLHTVKTIRSPTTPRSIFAKKYSGFCLLRRAAP